MKLKKIISILIIVILVLIILIFIMNKRGNNIVVPPAIESADSYKTIITSKLEEVKIKNDYYKVKLCIDKYNEDILSYYNTKESKTMKTEELRESDMRLYKNNIFCMIDDMYINTNGITEENIIEKIGEYRPNIFYIDNMYVVYNSENISTYVVYCKFSKDYYNQMMDYGFIIRFDYKNNTFSVIPYDYMLKKEYASLKSGDEIDMNNDNIPNKKHNVYKYTNNTEEGFSGLYMEDFKNREIFDIKSAYEKLDDEYKRIRFGNIDEYKKYIQNNINEIKSIRMSEYLVNNYNDYTEYVCKDQYGNLYIFKETAVMQYTLTLDTYTLENEKFTTTYEQSNDQKKVMMNVDKFFQMLNARDYKTSYEILDSGFKNNYFNTQEVYENYMRSAFPDHYKVEYTGFSNEGNILIQKVKLTSMENNTTMEKNIIMKLEEGTKFVMSFNIQ